MDSKPLNRLLDLPMWVDLSGAERRAAVFRDIAALVEEYEGADCAARRTIADALNRPAKYAMAVFTESRAAEGRRLRSQELIRQGLMAVVIAGGHPERPTPGSLLSLCLRSAEVVGLDCGRLFGAAADLALDPEVAKQIRSYPDLPPEMRAISRYGYHERRTATGVAYEHDVCAPRWWERVLPWKARRRVTLEDTLRVLREIESEYADRKREK